MLRRAVKATGFAVLVIVLALLLINAFPSVAGADYSFVVQSGSMEPAIPTGSIVFVKDVPAERIDEGDVITFSKGTGAITTTHRVIQKHQSSTSVRFQTKGDANEDPDSEPVYRSDLVGVVIFSVPYIGYLTAFASTRAGWVVFIAIPVTLLIASELWELYQALEPADENETHE